MHITTIKYGRTVKHSDDPKCFEYDRLDVEAIVTSEQKPDEVFAELCSYVGGKLSECSAKGNGAAPPLAKPNKAERQAAIAKPDVLAQKAKLAESEKHCPPDDNPPFDVDSAPAAEPGPEPKKRGRKPKKAAPTLDTAREEFQLVLDSLSLEELLVRFNKFRDPANGFVELLTLDQWEQSVVNAQSKYKDLMTTTANPETMNQLIKAITGERNAIDHKRQSAAA